MAIKFEDVKPGPRAASGGTRQADAPPAAREPDADALEASVEPELPHPKPQPKPRGRKKPLK